MEKPKKQFKSQSVNDLFRQQAANKAASSIPTAAKLERSNSPGNTKLRLVAKKVRTVNTMTLNKLKKPSSTPTSDSSKSTPEASSSASPSPTGIDDHKQEEIDPIQILPETIGKFINNSNAFESNNYEDQSNLNIPTRSRFNWDNQSNSNGLWNEMDNESWSPNSKISSFRRNTNLLNDITQNNSPFSSRQNSEIFTSLPAFTRTESHQPTSNRNNSNIGEFWKSPSIWNSHEERQLSTKSDSVINWSPFDIEALNLEDLKANNSSNDLRHQTSFDMSTRSRFFPSAFDEQLKQIPEQLQQQQLNYGFPVNRSISNTLTSPQQQRSNSSFQTIPIESPLMQPAQMMPITPLRQSFSENQQTPTKLIVSSIELEINNDTDNSIPVSLPINNTTFKSPEISNNIKTQDYELPHYPEGFSSTFYKRGVNNFMFIRELQPKIITSKYSDSVEIRLTFPIWDEDYRLKSSRVDIDVKELDGKLNGLKVSKPAPIKKPFRGNFNRNLVYNKR